ncbi:MAG: S41 family peptidase [Pseudomonadota bacterium]|nr:MAG: S41 family peptidase [Pseudomonadota bacterium]
MNVYSRNALILGFGLLLGVMLAVGHGVWADRDAGARDYSGLPLDEVRSLSEVFGKIKENYVEDVADKDLLENAIRGMLTGLDPHSTYLDKDAFQELRVGTTGEFGGLGIVVGMEDGFVKVVSPIDDTPAQRAGIKAGDLIIRLDDTPVKGMTLDDAVKRMRGPAGTDITLTVVREGVDKPFKVTVTRDRIRVKSVKSRVLEPGYGYVRITQFQERTGKELRDAIGKLKKDSEGNIKGLVLDLRNNPGGLLDAAVAVSDTFLDQGVIVSVRGRGKETQMTHQASPQDMLSQSPMVVLVNAGSASASEIVAGALQDHKRGIIMGQRTFGKGSVQTVVPLGNNTALKLTTARYYTPSDRSIQAEGIVPDIALDDFQVAMRKKSEFEPIKEADLSGHLDNGNKKKDKGAAPQGKGKPKSGAEPLEGDEPEQSLAESDYFLYEALNLLKGLHLLSAR